MRSGVDGELGGVRIFKPETVALMSLNAMGDISCHPIKTVSSALSEDVGFVDGIKWGISFMINPKPAGLANSYYWIDPVKKVTGVYATQVLPFY